MVEPYFCKPSPWRLVALSDIIDIELSSRGTRVPFSGMVGTE